MSDTHMPPLHEFLTDPSRAERLNPALVSLVETIADACRAIANHVRYAAFEGQSGAAGGTNVQGEEQKKLDVIADDEFARICSDVPRLAALVSEERDEITWLKEPEEGDYLVYYDPLDGSSNIDVDLSVGTIFSICQMAEGDRAEVLKSGIHQVCAGYAIYGPSTILVLTTGTGVNGFSCDDRSGDFRLTHADLTIPPTTSEFAINVSRYRHWDDAVRVYVDECLAGETGPRNRAFNMRWTASMVADVHRILIRGGVFLYPSDADNRDKGGKLRLLYEANPMALIAEQAGGKASTGLTRILEEVPQSHHQRISVILGSSEEVTRLEEYHQRQGGIS